MKPILLLFCLAIAFPSSQFAQETNAPAIAPKPLSPAVPRVMEGGLLGALTEEQRQSLTKPAEEQQEKLRELQQQLRTARQELFAVALRGKFDESAVRAKAQAVSNVELEMTVLRLKILSQVQPPLTPQQIERFKTLGFSAPGAGLRPPESRPGRQRILQNLQRDANDLPAKP